MTTVVEPVSISPLPSGPSTNDPDNFDDDADALVAALGPMITQQNAANATAYQNALAAAGAASNAAIQADAASSSAGQALEHRNAAEGFKTAAEAAKGAAEAARDAAQAAAVALTATSASLVAVGTGSKSFTIPADKQFPVGTDIKVIDVDNSGNAMYGTVTSYAGTTLQINVTSFEGAGTVANWRITLAGQRGGIGLTGGVNGGALQGALWEKKGADVASAASIDPWSAGGNYLSLVGVVAVTGFAAAPQAGVKVELLVTGVLPITAGANLIIAGVTPGQTYTCAPGDELIVRAETTTKFRVTIKRGDGVPVVQSLGSLHNVRRFTQSGVFKAKKTGWHKISGTGGSGSGGAATSPTGGISAASGAGAGGFFSGMRFLVAGQSYIVSIGAGGAAVIAPASGTNAIAQVGNAGSATTFNGPSITAMQANGGGPGGAAASNTTQAGAIAGGYGGTATGGDINVTGGAGGAVTFAAGVAAVALASGGGSAGVSGTGFAGGAVSVTTGAAAGAVATGGAGTGGAGGDATLTNSSAGGAYSAGGGADGPAAPVTNAFAIAVQAGANWKGEAGGTATPAGATVLWVINELDTALGGGGVPSSGIRPGPGGGGAGQQGNTNSAENGGNFAGGGGVAARTNGSITASRGGDFGGASGGVAQTGTPGQPQNQGAYGTPGQDGGLWIEW